MWDNNRCLRENCRFSGAATVHSFQTGEGMTKETNRPVHAAPPLRRDYHIGDYAVAVVALLLLIVGIMVALGFRIPQGHTRSACDILSASAAQRALATTDKIRCEVSHVHEDRYGELSQGVYEVGGIPRFVVQAYCHEPADGTDAAERAEGTLAKGNPVAKGYHVGRSYVEVIDRTRRHTKADRAAFKRFALAIRDGQRQVGFCPPRRKTE